MRGAPTRLPPPFYDDDEDGLCNNVMRRSDNYCSHRKKQPQKEACERRGMGVDEESFLSYRYGRDVEIFSVVGCDDHW